MKKTRVSHKPKDTHTISEPVVSQSKKNDGIKLAIIAGVVVVLFVILVGRSAVGSLMNNSNSMKTKTIPEAIKKVLGNPSTEFSIGAVKDVSGVYEFELTLGKGNSGQKYTSFITKDGKILFTSGIKLTTVPSTTGGPTQAPQKKLSCNDVPKTDAPKLSAYVVSQCPFGIQMQRVVKKAIDEQPELASTIDVRYMGSVSGDKITSMHGEAEATENFQQICIRDEQKDKYWDYVSCYMEEGKSEDCLTKTGVNVEQMKSCMTDTSRGIAYAKKDFALGTKLNVNSSPTLVLNDSLPVSEFDFGGRNPNSLKEIACCSTSTKPEYCSSELTKTDAATSFSVAYESQSGSTGTAANCN